MLEALGPRREILARVARAAAARGWRAALVGGAIVDLLEGRAVKDLDVVVEGDAPTLADDLAGAHGGEVLVHAAFRTATWTPPRGEPVDLVMARTEIYEAPAALPRVAPGTLEQDLGRRDFTVLCLAWELGGGQLLDPAGGQEDLADRMLRVQHPRSFHDDPTRAWRAARWAERLDLQLHPDTLAALHAARDDGAAAALGLERVGHELERAWAEVAPGRVFGRLADWGWLETLHPGLDPELPRALEALGHDREHLPWLLLARALPPEARPGLARLVTPGGEALRLWREGPERVTAGRAALAAWPDRAAVGRALSGLSTAEQQLACGAQDPAGTWWLDHGRALRTMVRAQDLLAAGVVPGPALGAALRAAQDAAWRGEDSTAQRRAAGLPPA